MQRAPVPLRTVIALAGGAAGALHAAEARIDLGLGRAKLDSRSEGGRHLSSASNFALTVAARQTRNASASSSPKPRADPGRTRA